MKIEQINIYGLISAYLKQNYHGKSVLMINTEHYDSDTEFETLLEELDILGYLPPKSCLLPGYIFIEMPSMVAKKVINFHNKGGIQLLLYEDGECVHENR